jgi:hypothetical protein
MNKCKPASRHYLKVVGFTLVASALSFSARSANYEWTFNSGNLSTSLGNGAMAYADAQSGTLTTFGSTGGGVPNIGGQVANFIHVPAFVNAANGYNLTLNDTGPNGGGSYVNQYTIIYDFLSPGPLNWTPFFNTDPANGNDADFYLAYDGTVGIGSLYSGSIIAPNTWYRLAFVANLSAGTMSYYVNGTQVASGSQGGSGLDGRWSLYSNLDAGHDLRLLNEPSGAYTHELYVNSIAFADRAMTGSELQALGGPNAAGIFAVPEPATGSLLLAGLAGLWLTRFRGKLSKV